MLKLAMRNVFRHRVRTALTLAAIVSGAAGLILSGGFVEDSLLQLREATIHSQIGHLQIYRAGFYERGLQMPYRFMIDNPAQMMRDVAGLPHVIDAMARLNFSGVLNNGRNDVPVVGVGLEPDKEARLGTSTAIVSGRALGASDRFRIILGEGVAGAMKIGPGDRVTILASTADGALNTLEFEVVGVFRSFSKDYDARTVRIPLVAAQELLDVKAANAIVLTLDDTEATPFVDAVLKARLDRSRFEVKAWDELADFYGKTEALYRRQFAVLQVIILVAVLLSVANSVNMSTYERAGEFGTLMAMGNRRRTIMRLVIAENCLLGLLGGVVGALAGALLAWGISAIGIPMPPPPNSNIGYTAAIRVVPRIVAAAALIAVAATVGAALVPAWRVARLPVVDALRRNQ